MKRALVGGIGNVLLGDDGIGPYVIRLLESRYTFGDDVETVDLGTPSLDLTHQIVGLHSLILVDSVASEDPPGAIVLYRKADILHAMPAQRLDPHSPALSECLMTADMLGASPEHVLLVGIVGKRYEPGEPLSYAVAQAAVPAVQAILKELVRLGFEAREKPSSGPRDISYWHFWGQDVDLYPVS